ncbi:MauE/DoxX family redox-associated membrane protein [Streptosporangium sp. NPDC002524]|uniref:MauE/DoxX family redox-associated membrane protein n=1 Tax=Streptosporangium sp. NPDC002524 TaxID=3154537 RepID=UPI00332322FD
MQYIAIGMRLLIGVVFLASAVSKVMGRRAFDDFTTSLGGMRIMPPSLWRPAAIFVIASEFAVCGLLAFPGPFTALAGFLLATGLLAVFTVAVATAVHRGVRAPCRCFGVSASPLGPRQITRNLILVLCAVLGAVTAPVTGPLAPAGTAVAVFGGLVWGGLAVVSDEILDLFHPIDKAPGLARDSR